MSEQCKYGYLAAAASHKGRVRASNEDAFGICAEDCLFVVCDGMGGAAAGEVASRVTVDTVVKILCQTPHNSSNGFANWQDEEDADLTVPALLREAVSSANHLVFAQAASDSRLHGMGTTLVALWVRDEGVYVAHVGDSRCYRFRSAGIEQITDDHSLVDEQVKLGHLTRAEAERSPLRNVITRAVGSQRSVTAEVTHVEAAPGDLFLLCSDGLTRELTDLRIEAVLNETEDLDLLCRRLVECANEAGGRDNVTCIIVRVP